jgi:YHS domain-containing protein
MNHISSRRATFLILVSLILAAPLGALDKVSRDKSGLAAGGYDTVAYFTTGKPVKGVAAFEHTWNGARWRFASAKHRDLFVKEPAKYAPQYGGYCAYAVSRNYTAPSDPNAWRVVGGKLYLNYNLAVREMWTPKAAENIRKGDANWPKLLTAK